MRSPVEKCLVELAPFFADRSELALTVSDGTLVLEGVPIFQLTSSLELFMARLGAIGLPAVIFERGVSVEDIELFVRFLHETKEQGLPIPEIKERLPGGGSPTSASPRPKKRRRTTSPSPGRSTETRSTWWSRR